MDQSTASPKRALSPDVPDSANKRQRTDDSSDLSRLAAVAVETPFSRALTQSPPSFSTTTTTTVVTTTTPTPVTSITRKAVIESGWFGELYFNIVAGSKVTTSLQVGMAMGSDTDNGPQFCVITAITTSPLVIHVLHINKNKLMTLLPSESHTVITSRQSINQLRFSNYNINSGDRIMLPMPYINDLLKFKECHGKVISMLKYKFADTAFIIADTPAGRRLWPQSYFTRMVPLTAEDDPASLLKTLRQVTLGSRVHDSESYLGTVVMLLYQHGARSFPYYVIQGEDGRIIFKTFYDRIFPVEDSVVETNALTTLQKMYTDSESTKRCVLYNNVAFRIIGDYKGKTMLAIERGVSHHFNVDSADSLPNSVFGFSYVTAETNLADYGFVAKSRIAKEVKCDITGRVTTYDYEE